MNTINIKNVIGFNNTIPAQPKQEIKTYPVGATVDTTDYALWDLEENEHTTVPEILKDWDNIPATLKCVLSYVRAHNSLGFANFHEGYMKERLATLATAGHLQMIEDSIGNFIVSIQREDNAPVRWSYVAHMDTVHSIGDTRQFQKVAHDLTTNRYHLGKDGVGCLGADDGVGVAVGLHLIANKVPGLYIFTVGEERGGIGASHLAKKPQLFKDIDFAIEIDRKGRNEVINEQGEGVCASEAFAEKLAQELSTFSNGALLLHASPLGSYTDVATLAERIPECVNISAGYDNAHTDKEWVDVSYVDALGNALRRLLENYTEKGSNLPIVRKAGDYYTGSSYESNYDMVGYNSRYGVYTDFEQEEESIDDLANLLYDYTRGDLYKIAQAFDAFGVDSYELDSILQDINEL